MPTTITLTLDSQTLEQAEAYARENGHDLAGLIETYLETMVRVRSHDLPLSPQVLKLYGSLKLPADVDYKQSLTDALTEHYGV